MALRYAVICGVFACTSLGVEAGGCHADMLISGVNYAAMSPTDQQYVSQAVSTAVANEIGTSPQNVLSKTFPGSYNAAWSPVEGRPNADLFMASLIPQCSSTEMVLGVMRGPQLQETVIKAVRSALSRSRSLSGEVEIIGASVVAAKDEELHPGASGSGSGGSSIVGFVMMGFGASLFAFCGWPSFKKKLEPLVRKEPNEEEYPFTGH